MLNKMLLLSVLTPVAASAILLTLSAPAQAREGRVRERSERVMMRNQSDQPSAVFADPRVNTIVPDQKSIDARPEVKVPDEAPSFKPRAKRGPASVSDGPQLGPVRLVHSEGKSMPLQPSQVKGQ